MKERIGFIGVRLMGHGMAKNLADHVPVDPDHGCAH